MLIDFWIIDLMKFIIYQWRKIEKNYGKKYYERKKWKKNKMFNKWKWGEISDDLDGEKNKYGIWQLIFEYFNVIIGKLAFRPSNFHYWLKILELNVFLTASIKDYDENSWTISLTYFWELPFKLEIFKLF